MSISSSSMIPSTLSESASKRLATESMLAEVDDLRIRDITPIASPHLLMSRFPLTPILADHVKRARIELHDILHGLNDRLLVVVGPCSIHDVKAGLEYAKLLLPISKELEADLKIVMRVYFEKPRTTVGWKGLINDPDLDGSYRINKGLKMARKFLLEVNQLGLCAGVEFLDTITPQYFGDLVAWGAIGARTTESQVHRELASGLSCPIGFKNGTSGSVQVAIDACLASSMPHSFLSVTKDGVVAIAHTSGNSDCHIILRGGSVPNYDKESVSKAITSIRNAKLLSPRIVIDCSHGNSSKNPKNQPIVAEAIGEQVANGNFEIKGLMIESHLNEGNQSLNPGVTKISDLKYGVSVTDGCIDFQATEQVLRKLALSVQSRREFLLKSSSTSISGNDDDNNQATSTKKAKTSSSS